MLGSTSQINSFMNVFGVQPGLSMDQAAKMISTVKPNHAADSVTISPSANMMQQLLNMELQNPDGSSELGELDLTGLAQLKQRGDMLANMLQVKLKSFESNLINGMKAAGLDPSQDMSMKNGDDGLSLMNDIPNKESVQNFLQQSDKLKGQFQEIAQFANILDALQQFGPGIGSGTSGHAGILPATQYTQQSQPVRPEKRPDAEFVVRVMQGSASYSFE